MAMKTSGEIGPRVGWSQRASASTAPGMACRERDRSAGRRPSGCRSSMAVRKVGLQVERGRVASTCISGSEQDPVAASEGLGPVHRGIGIAEQVVRRTRCPLPATAIPMLPRPVIWRPSILDRRRRRRWMQAGGGRDRHVGASTSSRRTANSSPPSRATQSAGPDDARAGARPTTWSSVSPAACPRLSLTVLNSSRSRKRTAG